ncbi:MAG TPA: formyl transferase [Hanamia sp.]|nr:formyl transferase [Hanamia sp.]
MKSGRIVILAGKGDTTNIVYNYLKNYFHIEAVVFEKGISKTNFLKKRIRKLGISKVVGQVLFQLFIVKWLDLNSKKRKKEILEQYQLNTSSPPAEKTIHVDSVNDLNTIEILKKLNPDLIVVNGTRIISADVLNSSPVKFLNTHTGITPKYRNVHGAYWAIVNDDMNNCGVTVHLVDKGIDTGNIIFQKTIQITSEDNFVTYPFLQIGEGISYLKKAIDDIFANQLKLIKGTTESRIWYHPTLVQYIRFRIKKGVK